MRDTRRLVAALPLKVSRVGLRAFQRVGGFIKPTTWFIQIFGAAATRARLEIGGKQLQRLLAGQEIPLDLDLTKGYVILSFPENRILGLGFFINGKVRSQISKKELRLVMVENEE